MRRAIPLVVILALSACFNTKSTPTAPDMPTDPTKETYAVALGIDITKFSKTTGGVFYKDSILGTGATLAAASVVNMTWSEYLTNGALVSYATTAQSIGLGTVLPALVNGMIGMKEGGTRRIILPSELAYKADGYPALGIPPNATLIFDVGLSAITQP